MGGAARSITHREQTEENLPKVSQQPSGKLRTQTLAPDPKPCPSHSRQPSALTSDIQGVEPEENVHRTTYGLSFATV